MKRCFNYDQKIQLFTARFVVFSDIFMSFYQDLTDLFQITILQSIFSFDHSLVLSNYIP